MSSTLRITAPLLALSLACGGKNETPSEPQKPAEAPAAESEAPGVLDDLEQWMHTLGRKTRARGGRHAVVRV